MSSKVEIKYEEENPRHAPKRKSEEENGYRASSSDKRDGPSCSKGARVAPLFSLKGGYLSVSDFVHQVWCEKQMEYSLTSHSRRETCLSIRGKTLHLERDLEVNDYVSLKCNDIEDNFAIHFINLLSALYEIQNQLTPGLREVPIFGVFDGIFLMGRVDELRVDYDDFTIDLVEFKTKRRKEPLSDAQISKNSVQLMLYKKMFDDLVRGEFHLEDFAKNLKLDLFKPLGADIRNHIENNLGFLKELLKNDVWTLNFLIERIVSTAKFLPAINRCFIECAWQRDGQIFHLQEIEYDFEWIEGKLKPFLSYWHGEREAEGVDIEENWKCGSCEFRSGCDWRNYF